MAIKKHKYRKGKVYITGAVGDLTDDEYYNSVVCKFQLREDELSEQGYQVINPLKLVSRDTTWHEAMKICIKTLCDCEYVSPLPCSKESPGAKVELALAEKLKLTFIYKSKL